MSRFHDLLREMGELHDKKAQDYGTGEDPLANVRASTHWGIPAWVGAMVRLNDKVVRLQSLAAKGVLANEAAVDSFMDIAVYALIARILYEEEHPPFEDGAVPLPIIVAEPPTTLAAIRSAAPSVYRDGLRPSSTSGEGHYDYRWLTNEDGVGYRRQRRAPDGEWEDIILPLVE